MALGSTQPLTEMSTMTLRSSASHSLNASPKTEAVLLYLEGKAVSVHSMKVYEGIKVELH